MLRFISSAFLVFFIVQTAAAQEVSVAVTDTVPYSFMELLNPVSAIRKDSILNERLVDLVQVREYDTVVETRTQWHRLPIVGLIARCSGFCWRSVDRKRHKMVGTIIQNYITVPGGPGSDHFTEFDVTFNPVPHLHPYIDMVYQAHVRQQKMPRAKTHTRDKHDPPYAPPPADGFWDAYNIHCEFTPPKRFREQLNAAFYPCYPGPNVDGHFNFHELRPTFGLYGALILDCNHNCHPEIHPYEMLWWLDNSLGKNEQEKRWMVGLFKEGSNRFRGWSKSPRVGIISVPFLFPVNAQTSTIHVDHLVFSEFMPNELKRIGGVPADAATFNFTQKDMELKQDGAALKKLSITTNYPVANPGLKFWLSDVKTDSSKKWVYGYFNIVASVHDLYTARVTYSTQ